MPCSPRPYERAVGAVKPPVVVLTEVVDGAARTVALAFFFEFGGSRP